MTNVDEHDDEPGMGGAEIIDLANLVGGAFETINRSSEQTAQLEQAPHSWTPINLAQRALEPPEPATISGLVYPGRRHVFSGKPESLKSWLAMILCVDQIRNGKEACYVDHEMGARETLTRLRDLCLSDDELSHFIYISPDEPFLDPEIIRDTQIMLAERQPSIVVIDAFTGALSLQKLNPNIGVEIETYYQTVIDPLRAYGAAIVVLDHLPKDPLNHGMFSIGSERKVGAADVHLGFEIVVPFGRGRSALAKITTHKDRPGHLPRPRTADLELHSDTLTSEISWKLMQPDPSEQTEDFRPTALMEKVSRYLEIIPDEPASVRHIESNVEGKSEFVRKALNTLVLEGWITESKGVRNSRLFTIKTPYRQSDDEHQTAPCPTVSHRVPDTVATSSPDESPPLQGGDTVESDRRTQTTVSHDDEPGITPGGLDEDIPF